MRCVIITLLFSLITSVVCAQEVDSLIKETTKLKLELVPTTSMGVHVNLQDFYLDFGAGAYEQNSKIGAQLNCSFRPFYKKVQIYQEANIIRQWKEKKYLISLDLYKRILEFNVAQIRSSLIAGAKTGYLFGDYRGTRERPQSGFTINPYIGISLWLNGVFVDLAYLYFNDRIATVPDGRLMVSLNIPIKP